MRTFVSHHVDDVVWSNSPLVLHIVDERGDLQRTSTKEGRFHSIVRVLRRYSLTTDLLLTTSPQF